MELPRSSNQNLDSFGLGEGSQLTMTRTLDSEPAGPEVVHAKEQIYLCLKWMDEVMSDKICAPRTADLGLLRRLVHASSGCFGIHEQNGFETEAFACAREEVQKT